jgi:hypothetical protein
MIRSATLILTAACLTGALSGCSKGESVASGPPIPLLLKNHVFSPAAITVKANQPFVLEVTNADGVADEFDSDSLKREKVIAGGAKGIVHVDPLPPGRYPFMGEYHAKTAQGVVIVQ